MTDNVKLDVKVGDFVAMRKDDVHSEIPIIGKIIKIKNDGVVVELWQGAYNKTWKARKENGDLVYEDVHMKDILTKVSFTNSKRLPIDVKRKLQSLYN